MGATMPSGERDPRLDFFRGLALFIILVSHTRGDWLAEIIPARFGLSDAANLFVFMSGVAGGIAFGGVFRRSGFWMGTVRIAHRCWQLYVVHILSVIVVGALTVAADHWFETDDYIGVLQVGKLFTDPAGALGGLFTLGWVPHYLDILPVYMLVLAMVPVAVLLARLHPLAVPAGSILLWLLAGRLGWNLTADAADGRVWFFNPFAWQLLFFSGFSLSMGWLAVPIGRRLFWISVAVLVVGLLLTQPAIYLTVPGLAEAQVWVLEHTDKTDLDPMQLVHFLASAVVVVALLRGSEQRLGHGAFRWIMKCGQQALAVFLSGIVLAQLGSMAFDHLGTDMPSQLLVNPIIIGASIGVAYLVAWFKSTPWKQRPRVAAPAAATLAVGASAMGASASDASSVAITVP
jgi:hypothetical protein